MTYRGSQDSPAFSRVLAEAISGEVTSLAFVVPSRVTWPLPLYELALQTATRLADERIEARIVLLTPEEAPLGVFGHAGSELVAKLLADKGIELQLGVHVDKFDQGLVHLVPGPPVPAERAIALPGLRGIPIAGIPADSTGFVHIDAHARVNDLGDVYAAGDGTSFPVKQEGSPRRWRTSRISDRSSGRRARRAHSVRPCASRSPPDGNRARLPAGRARGWAHVHLDRRHVTAMVAGRKDRGPLSLPVPRRPHRSCIRRVRRADAGA